MGIKKWLILPGLCCWLLVSCQSVYVPPVATNTPQLTTTSRPTHTSTPRPTPTPITPTPTVAPPAVLTKYLESVRIVKVDTFDNGARWNASYEISNGVLQLVGEGGDAWYGLAHNGTFQEGEGVIINFKFTAEENFEMYFDNRVWNTNSYKRFGVYVRRGYSSANLFFGKEGRGSGSIPGNFSLSPDTWYSLFMVVGKEGDFLALIWDPSNPDRSFRYREVI
ncbi:MAG: hypothetical protein WCC12_01085, partial [Anaerolineales bacterium]